MKDDIVKHKGIISEITHDKIRVNIVAQSACAACHAKGYCGVADMTDKVIEVRNNVSYEQNPGDFVNVTMKKKQGIKAVVYGYFLPFLLLIITLIVATAVLDQGIAGLIAISILIPYYLILYVIRNRLKNEFEFQIEKLN